MLYLTVLAIGLTTFPGRFCSVTNPNLASRLRVRDRLLLARPVFCDRAAIEIGLCSAMILMSSIFLSLSVSDSDFMLGNQIFGSRGLGLYRPRATATARARNFSCGRMPIVITFKSHLSPSAFDPEQPNHHPEGRMTLPKPALHIYHLASAKN